MDDCSESCKFETSEMLASFVASTTLLSDSWKLCNAANVTRTIQTQHGGGIWYVAFPAVQNLPSGELVALGDAVEGNFSAFSRTSAAEEPPPMVDAEMLSLFSSTFPFIQPQMESMAKNETSHEDADMVTEEETNTQKESRTKTTVTAPTSGPFKSKIRKLVVTGHSTGGAMASLAALSLLSSPQSVSSSSFHVLCITFGSPLLGNQPLSTAISRLHLDRNFCHVASTRDVVPRFLMSPRSSDIARLMSTSLHFRNSSSVDGLRQSEFWPFGSYLFCSEEGGICMDDAASVSKMLLMLNTRTLDIEDHLKYGDYVEILSLQFLKARSFNGGNVSESTYTAGLSLAVEAIGISREEPAAAEATECIQMSRRISLAPILKSAELSIQLAKNLRFRLEIQWYKERCDVSKEQLGYYDFFKRGTMRRDYNVNISRGMLARFWDGVIEMIEKKELPFSFHLQAKWLFASQFYQLLAEPLDIAYFYKNRKPEDRGRHYLMQGNRPKRYEEFDKWWREQPWIQKKKYERTRYASATQDTCFWARLEEAKEYLDDVRTESDGYKQSILWEKIYAFERYADELVKMKEVSIDVLAENSSYKKWVTTLQHFKSQMSPEFSVVDEDAPMETL